MLNKSLARLSRCFDGLTRVLVSSRTVSHSVQSKVTRTMLLLSHVCMLFCPASVTYARSLRYVVAGAHDGIGLGIGKTKSRVCIRNTAVRVRLRGVCDNRGLPNILLKWVCPTLASTLYILQNDAVQQLSVLLLITELTVLPTLPGGVFHRVLRRRSRRERRGSSGLDWGWRLHALSGLCHDIDHAALPSGLFAQRRRD